MEHLFPLLEMGYGFDEVERAHSFGCRSVEEAVELLTGEIHAPRSSKSQGKLVLRTHARSSESMFSTRPFYVDLSHLNQPDNSGTSEPVEPSSSATNVPEQFGGLIHNKHKAQEDAFSIHQMEAHRLANMLKKERLERAEEKERLLAEIKSDKEARRLRQFTSSSPPSGLDASDNQTNSQPSDPLDLPHNDQIRIKVRFDNNVKAAPVILRLPNSAVYRDLLDAIQEHVLRVVPVTQPLLSTSIPTDIVERLEQHLRNIHTTDPCIQLIVHTWPRRTLPHCSTTLTNQNPTSLIIPLSDLGITDGVGVSIRHVKCPFELPVSIQSEEYFTHPFVASTSNEGTASPGTGPPSESSTSHVDPVFQSPSAEMAERRFPPSGHQLIPRPPGSVLPLNTLSVRENVRRAALRLQQERMHSRLDEAAEIYAEYQSRRRFPPVTSLADLCREELRNLIVRYLDACDSARIGSESAFRASEENSFALDYWVIHSLRTTQWPAKIGRQLVADLCANMRFNVQAAGILRNCTTSLDLGYYQLATRELIYCLISRWPHLTELYLDGLYPSQLPAHAVTELRHLRNLRLLSLVGVKVVCDENICDILSLPNLQFLYVPSTRVTDAGWIEANRLVHFSGRNPLPLQELNASDLGSCLTNSGLKAIICLFPLLLKLHMRSAHITEDIEPEFTPLQLLTYLDLSSCANIHYVPYVLIPPSSAEPLRSGLVELHISNCTLLDLNLTLHQIQGHPIEHLKGFETLNSLNALSLEALSQSRFPLREVNMRPINSEWMVQSPRLLVQVLFSLHAPSLIRLSLPQRPIRKQAGDDSLAIAFRQMKRFVNLRSLDFGGQVGRVSECDAIVDIVPHLTKLRSIVFVDLSDRLAKPIHAVCPPYVEMRVQHYV